MNFENFREQFTEDVKQKLFESGIEANVSTQEVTKLNESYHAITVTLEGSNVGVNVNVNRFYEVMENGNDYDAIVDKALDVITNGINERPATITESPRKFWKNNGNSNIAPLVATPPTTMPTIAAVKFLRVKRLIGKIACSPLKCAYTP